MTQSGVSIGAVHKLVVILLLVLVDVVRSENYLFEKYPLVFPYSSTIQGFSMIPGDDHYFPLCAPPNDHLTQQPFLLRSSFPATIPANINVAIVSVSSLPEDIERIPPKRCCLSIFNIFLWNNEVENICQEDDNSNFFPKVLYHPCDRYLKVSGNSTAIRPVSYYSPLPLLNSLVYSIVLERTLFNGKIPMYSVPLIFFIFMCCFLALFLIYPLLVEHYILDVI